MNSQVKKPNNHAMGHFQKVFAVPQEFLQEAIDVLHDLRRSVCPIEQIRPLSIAEAARALRCRRKEVEHLIDEGVLPFVKRHGRRYILPADLHRRLKEEAGFEKAEHKSRKKHISKQIRPDLQGIDPSLREFFD